MYILYMREVLFILAVFLINRYSVKKPDIYLMSTKLSLNQMTSKLNKSFLLACFLGAYFLIC